MAPALSLPIARDHDHGSVQRGFEDRIRTIAEVVGSAVPPKAWHPA